MDVLLYLVIGIVLGLRLVPRAWHKYSEQLQQLAMIAAMFFMGVSLGAQPDLLPQLVEAGGAALVFALATVAGSVFFTWLAAKYGLRGRDKPARAGTTPLPGSDIANTLDGEEEQP